VLAKEKNPPQTFRFSPKDFDMIEPLRISQQKAMSKMAKEMEQKTHFNYNEVSSMGFMWDMLSFVGQILKNIPNMHFSACPSSICTIASRSNSP
jgi:hypothetical protein